MPKLEKTFSPDEFRVIYHRELNNPKPYLEILAENTDSMKEKIKGRTLITALEGDIVEYRNEIFFAHMLYAKRLSPTNFSYKRIILERDRKAARFEDAIDHLIQAYKPHLGPIELEVELKDNLTLRTIEKVNLALKETGIPYFFASFYKDALEGVNRVDPNVRTMRHCFMTIDNKGYNVPILGMTEPSFEPTIVTSSSNRSYGKINNIIYTGDNPQEKIIQFSENLNIKGAFISPKSY